MLPSAPDSASRFDQVGNPVKPQPLRMLQGVQSIFIDQCRVGACRQQALNNGCVPLHNRQDQGCAPRRVSRIERRALSQQALELLQVSGASGLLQRAGQPE